MSISREQVQWVYRVFLGRDPESEERIAEILLHYNSRVDLILSVLDSDEFRDKRHETA